MEGAFATVAEQEQDRDLATLASQLGRFHMITADYGRGLDRIEVALQIAESLRSNDLISEALNSKALALMSGRPQEAFALLERALELALENDHASAALRSYNNLGHLMAEMDRYDDGVRYLEHALALARRRGNRQWELGALGTLIEAVHYLGRWDDACEYLAQIPEDLPRHGLTALLAGAFPATRISTARGEPADRALASVEASNSDAGARADVQEQLVLTLTRAIFARGDGNYHEALALADEVCAGGFANRLYSYAAEGWVEAVESALALGEVDGARERIAELDARAPVEINRYLAAHRARLGARIDAPAAAEAFELAVRLFREIGARFWLAVTLLEQSEWLYAANDFDAAAPVLAEAAGIFEELGARPWLERAQALRLGVVSQA
jgi:tetratricopeptide repeat protein